MAPLRSRSPGSPFLDEVTAEGLLAGTVDADDLPPPFEPVARLLRVATEPGHAHEMADEDAVVRMFVAERRAAGRQQPPTGSTQSGPLARRFAVAVLVGGLVLGGGAAAATGHLPGRAQAVAHDTLANFGVDIPDAPEDRPKGDEVGTTKGDRDPSSGRDGSAGCIDASDGRCRAGRQDRTEDRGSNGGDEPADPGDLGGAPGSVGPPSSTPPTNSPTESDPEQPTDEKSEDEKEKDEKEKKEKDEKDKPGKPKDEKPKPKDAPEPTPGDGGVPEPQGPPSSVP